MGLLGWFNGICCAEIMRLSSIGKHESFYVQRTSEVDQRRYVFRR